MIWFFAFGYFAAYVPYSALTKALSSGWIIRAGEAVQLAGLVLLPISMLTALATMLISLTVLRWWSYANHISVAGFNLPVPGRTTFFSGLCTSMIAVTTTLAYTFEGVSIVLVMLLMRGGLLVLAPFVDITTGRRPSQKALAALVLSLLALIVAFTEHMSFEITLICSIDIILYLSAYFIRLSIMSQHSKNNDPNTTKAFFVEEQLIAVPALVGLLSIAALSSMFYPTSLTTPLAIGFTEVWTSQALPIVLVIGACSQMTGIFGGLILLDARSNAYTVPVNRCSSILAGVTATYILAMFFDAPLPSTHRLIATAMVVVSIVILAWPTQSQE